MSGEAAAARIVKRIAGKGADMSAGQGIRLGTIKSVSPLSLTVDGMAILLTSTEVLVCDACDHPDQERSLKGGDRVAVAPVGNGCWVVLCRVVKP